MTFASITDRAQGKNLVPEATEHLIKDCPEQYYFVICMSMHFYVVSTFSYFQSPLSPCIPQTPQQSLSCRLVFQ